MVEIKKECRYFKGEKPCIWNKTKGYECGSCEEYQPRGKNILVIKLDAVGDVLRTTCIIPKIKEKFPEAYLTWVTMPKSMKLLKTIPEIDEAWDYCSPELSYRIQVQKWDYVYNLDNSYASSSLASIVNAKEKTGFIQNEEGLTPTNDAARYWMEMAVFDAEKKKNKKSYQEIMYEICGVPLPILKPSLHISEENIRYAKELLGKLMPQYDHKKPLIGINTGASSRWPKKMLNIGQITKVVKALFERKSDCHVILLGGASEKDKNKKIAEKFSSENVVDVGCDHGLLQFAAILKQCHALLCGDTLALHIATALDIPVVAIFGPTSYAEIYDYNGLVKKIQAETLDCLCCYGDCDKKHNCLSELTESYLADEITEHMMFQCEKSGV